MTLEKSHFPHKFDQVLYFSFLQEFKLLNQVQVPSFIKINIRCKIDDRSFYIRNVDKKSRKEACHLKLHNNFELRFQPKTKVKGCVKVKCEICPCSRYANFDQTLIEMKVDLNISWNHMLVKLLVLR